MKVSLLIGIYFVMLGCNYPVEQSAVQQPVLSIPRKMPDTAIHPGTVFGELLLLQKDLQAQSANENPDIGYTSAMMKYFTTVISLSDLELSQGGHAIIAAKANELNLYASRELPVLQRMVIDLKNGKTSGKQVLVDAEFKSGNYAERIAHFSSADNQYSKAMILLSEAIITFSNKSLTGIIDKKLRIKLRAYVAFFRSQEKFFKKIKAD